MPHTELQQVILEKLEKIEKLLTGNGKPSDGMIVRLDRVERGQKIIKWVVGAAIVSLLTAGAETGFTKLFLGK